VGGKKKGGFTRKKERKKKDPRFEEGGGAVRKGKSLNAGQIAEGREGKKNLVLISGMRKGIFYYQKRRGRPHLQC